MSKIKDENYFQVSGWMINRLQLKGNELIVFAIIYGFSQTESQWFTGTRKYLSEFAGCSAGTIDNCLSSLTSKGLIEKQESSINGVKFCKYRANYNTTSKFIIPPQKNYDTPLTKIVTDDNTRDNNIYNNIPPYNPPSGESDFETTPSKKDNSKEIRAELKSRINALFKRRESTTWTDKETAKLHQIARRDGVLEEMTEIEKLYNSGYQYRRNGVQTFLNNWTTELDRARNYKPQPVNRFDNTTREVDFEPGF